jgi:hypothetical protein
MIMEFPHYSVNARSHKYRPRARCAHGAIEDSSRRTPISVEVILSMEVSGTLIRHKAACATPSGPGTSYMPPLGRECPRCPRSSSRPRVRAPRQRCGTSRLLYVLVGILFGRLEFPEIHCRTRNIQPLNPDLLVAQRNGRDCGDLDVLCGPWGTELRQCELESRKLRS